MLVGFALMALGAMAKYPDLDLKIVPVGLMPPDAETVAVNVTCDPAATDGLEVVSSTDVEPLLIVTVTDDDVDVG